MFSNNQDLPCPALQWMGFDIQTSTPDQWRKTADRLKRARDDGVIRSFYDQSYIDALENEETFITQAWSGDIFIASAPKSIGGDGYPTLHLALPKEGAVLWTDNMCIPLHAEHPVDAIKMMNFVYQPTIAAQLADFIWYISPVPAAKEVVAKQIDDPAVANSALVFPSASDLAKTHKYKVFKDPAEEEEWNSIWEPVYSS
jgi:spermidine/putrescine transport system substrate-binding protein